LSPEAEDFSASTSSSNCRPAAIPYAFFAEDGKYSLPSVYPSEYMVTVIKQDANAPQDAAIPVAAGPLQKYAADSPLRAKVSESAKTFDFNLM